MCLSGNGWKPFCFKKSNTLIPYNSETRHGWFRKSKYSSRCIHLLNRFSTCSNETRLVVNLLVIPWIMLSKRFKHSDLNFARLTVLLHGPDNLDRDFTPCLNMSCFNHLTKRSLTQ